MTTQLTIYLLLVLALAVLLLPTQVAAFGAGNIASISYVEGKAFRHGDIEDVLASIVMTPGLIGLLSKKFSSLDIKRVYFGNWLRDYSQAIDVGTLSKGLAKSTLVTLVAVLGFMAFGYGTEEFEVTEERLGCYRAEEHIDNPKGYAEGQDARRYDQGLRGPIDPREMEVDPRTGMKNFIANEQGGWATSTAYVRRSLENSIQQYRQGNHHEALRLLGQALHTVEDFPAHTNFVELALIELGHTQVFPFVGEATAFRQNNGRPIYPIVTGTFGGTDFIHSLLGEATDHVASTSISSLSTDMQKAKQSFDSRSLPDLLNNVPGMGDLSREADEISRASAAGGGDPNNLNIEELKAKIWRILVVRDKIVKSVAVTIDKIPGLSWVTEKISETVQLFVLSNLEPLLKPLIQQVVGKLQNTSAEVVDSATQKEVFTNPHCSDPTHSMLSKDHFDLHTNEPAGLVGKVIVEHVAKAVVKAWTSNDQNASNEAINTAMQVFFHPADLGFPKTPFQQEMMNVVRGWADANRAAVAQLDKRSVEAGLNKRHPAPGAKIEAPVFMQRAAFEPTGGHQQHQQQQQYPPATNTGYGNNSYGQQQAAAPGYGGGGYQQQRQQQPGYGHPPAPSGYGYQQNTNQGYAPPAGYPPPQQAPPPAGAYGYNQQQQQPQGYGNQPGQGGYGTQQPPHQQGYPGGYNQHHQSGGGGGGYPGNSGY
ncbi:putative heterokaryon incompatibility protein HET-C [Phlyctochytrium arcticum]|nr:putative heterokaryon incompatibility protein HET-C [Phlyctochytrium arcticum]